MLGAVQHLTTAELEAGLAEVRRSPADAGVVELVVARPEVGVRDLLEEGTLDLEKRVWSATTGGPATTPPTTTGSSTSSTPGSPAWWPSTRTGGPWPATSSTSTST